MQSHIRMLYKVKVFLAFFSGLTNLYLDKPRFCGLKLSTTCFINNYKKIYTWLIYDFVCLLTHI